MNCTFARDEPHSYPAKAIIEKGKILIENANQTYHYGRILTTTTPYPKYPIIAKFFNNIGRADKLGLGVRNLYKYTKVYSDGEPVLFEADLFMAEIRLSGIATADKMPINHQPSLILDYIKENGSISNIEACNILNLKPPKVREILREMVDIGLLSAVGVKKNRRYLISSKM